MNTPIIIVDDEPRAHIVLENYISRIPSLHLVAKFTQAEEAISFLRCNPVDIVLLDITMPETDGFEFLRMLQKPPLVIFTTAHSEYAVESYDYSAIDYLKKPVPFERFVRAIDKARSVLMANSIKTIQDNIQLKVNGELKAIPFENILYFQSLGNYIKVHTPDKILLTQVTTHEIEDSLPKELFLRIHKSYIVNKSKMVRVTEEEIVIQSARLPIGKTFKKYVKESFFQSNKI